MLLMLKRKPSVSLLHFQSAWYYSLTFFPRDSCNEWANEREQGKASSPSVDKLQQEKGNRWQRMREKLRQDDHPIHTLPFSSDDEIIHDHPTTSSSIDSSTPRVAPTKTKTKLVHVHDGQRRSGDAPDPRLPLPPDPFDILPSIAPELPPIPDDYPRPHMTVLTFATHAQFKFCELVESCLQSDISLRVLGWGLQRGLVGVKLPGTVKALEEMPDDDVGTSRLIHVTLNR
jgi:hypothetical protein